MAAGGSGKGTVMDLAPLVDSHVRVKFSGGREGKCCMKGAVCVGCVPEYFGGKVLMAWASTVSGILKGFDQLSNLVLDDCVEFIRGEQDMGMPSVGFFWTNQHRRS